MASKLKKNAGDDDLEILHPEVTVTIGGKKVTVREYGFVESLRLRPMMQPFLTALGDLVEKKSVGFSLDDVQDVISEHIETVMPLIAAATDLPLDTVTGLSQPEGEKLLFAWWSVTSPFFVRQLQHRIFASQLSRRKKQNSDGVTSTPLSSPQDTMQTESEITPSDS